MLEWIRRLDTKATTKLGFLSGTLLSPIFGGGIPVWLISRGLMLLVVLLVSGHYVKKYNNYIVASRDQEWEERLEKEVAYYSEKIKLHSEETAWRVSVIEMEYSKVFVQLEQQTGELEQSLALERMKKPPTECVAPGTLDVLKKKAHRINQGGQK